MLYVKSSCNESQQRSNVQPELSELLYKAPPVENMRTGRQRQLQPVGNPFPCQFAGPRYTRDALRSLLLLLGCKPRLAYKISSGVFAAVDAAVASARGARGCRRTTFQVC